MLSWKKGCRSFLFYVLETLNHMSVKGKNMYGKHIGMLAFIKSPFMYIYLTPPL